MRLKLMHLIENPSMYSLVDHYPNPSTALKLEKLLCVCAKCKDRLLEVLEKEAPHALLKTA
jgi:hypothetical protein